MPDFSSVSPKTWEETLLEAIVNSTSLANTSKANTLVEFLLERQAGITDIGVDFTNVIPKTNKEKLLSDVVNSTSYFTGSPKDYIESALKEILDSGDGSGLREPIIYKEYLYFSLIGVLSGATYFRLLESGDFRLLEDGTSKRLLEAA